MMDWTLPAERRSPGTLRGGTVAGGLRRTIRPLIAGTVAGLSILMAGTGSASADSHLSFDIDLTLSAKAAAKLKSTKEGITVLASYYGDPSAAGENHTNELGTVDLASVTVAKAGEAGKVHVSGRDIAAQRLGWVVKPMVNVNVFSSRKASEENILDCDLIDGEVDKVVKSSPVAVRCWLIGENVESKTYP